MDSRWGCWGTSSASAKFHHIWDTCEAQRSGIASARRLFYVYNSSVPLTLPSGQHCLQYEKSMLCCKPTLEDYFGTSTIGCNKGRRSSGLKSAIPSICDKDSIIVSSEEEDKMAV